MSKQIRIRSLGRIISGLPDFDLYGVAGMIIEGSLTVFWSTGRDATTTLEYSYDSSDPSTFDSVTISGVRTHHQIVFPDTLIDTDHYFRVRSTDPATGEEKVSSVYRVYVPKRLVLSSEAGGTAWVKPVQIQVVKRTIKTVHNIENTVNDAFATPTISSEIFLTNPTTALITVPKFTPSNTWTITTNILSTNVA